MPIQRRSKQSYLQHGDYGDHWRPFEGPSGISQLQPQSRRRNSEASTSTSIKTPRSGTQPCMSICLCRKVVFKPDDGKDQVGCLQCEGDLEHACGLFQEYFLTFSPIQYDLRCIHFICRYLEPEGILSGICMSLLKKAVSSATSEGPDECRLVCPKVVGMEYGQDGCSYGTNTVT